MKKDQHQPFKHSPPPDSGERSREPFLRPTAGGAAVLRKKVASVRTWLVVDSSGQAHVVEVGKHEIKRRTGLPARDLRILDPVLSYPSTVLGRERAIVVNLEHIKAIITSQEVFFLNSGDPLVTPFVKKIQGIFRQRQACMSPKEARVDVDNKAWEDLYNSEEPQPTPVSPQQFDNGSFQNKNEESNTDGEQQVGENAQSLKLLPFEFVALEACLEAASSSLDNEARRLEQEAHPALDKLTSQISTLNLERVRQIKSRLVAITGRVQKVRDELEHLLDDDEDMAKMYLTHKFEEQQMENSSISSPKDLDGIDEEEVQPPIENRTSAVKFERNSSVCETDNPEIDNDHEQTIGKHYSLRRHSLRSNATKNLDVEELEMILEAYFVQIEGALNKLSTRTTLIFHGLEPWRS